MASLSTTRERRMRRITTTPITNAMTPATKTMAMRRIIGLVRRFITASNTNPGSDCQEKSYHRHATEENSKWHLMTTQCDYGRCLSMFAGLTRGFVVPHDAAASTFCPDNEYSPQTKERSGNGCGEYRK